MLRKLSIGVIAAMTAIGLISCGGGGGAAGTSGGVNANLFITGAANSSFDHVWATVTKVDLVGSSGKTSSVYNSTSTGGQVVDLLSLQGTSGQQYMLLTGFKAPAGAYTGANVTVSSSVSIVPKGSSSAVSATFAGSAGSSTVLTSKFATAQNFATSKNVVVNFNLANWNLNGTTISAPNNQFVQCGPPNGPFGPGNQIGDSYFGAVSNLSGTAPTLTFALGFGPTAAGPVCIGNVVNVVTSASTVISNSDGSTNPVLTNGELVDVAGTFDTTNNVLDATTITIHVGALPPPPAMVFGLVTAESLANNTITLTVNGCGGFQPDSTSLTVNVTPNTTYVDLSGVTDTEAQFFGNLVLGTTNIQVQGTQSGSAMTANSIRIVPPMIIGGGGGGGGNSGGGGPMTVSVGGPVSNVDASADTFSLTVAQWTGGWETPNMVLSVVTTPTTTYRANSTDISAAVFFSQLATSSVVHVRGTLDPTTSILTADSMGLIPPPGFKKG